MVKWLRWAVATLVVSGCQLSLDQACPTGADCPSGSFCGADGYCHPGATAAGSTSTSTGGTSASTGTNSSTTGAVTSVSTSSTTGAVSTTGGSISSTGSSTGTSPATTSGSVTTSSGSTTGFGVAPACAPGDAGSFVPDAGFLDAGSLDAGIALPLGPPLTLSGTVTVPARPASAVPGELHIQLGSFLGTSFHVCGPGTYAFQLNGIPLGAMGGAYDVTAWLDTDVFQVVSPVPALDLIAKGVVSLATTNAAAIALTLAPTTQNSLPAIVGVSAVEGNDGGVLVEWSLSDAGIADSYLVCVAALGEPQPDAGVCSVIGPGLGGAGGLVILPTAAVNQTPPLQATVTAILQGNPSVPTTAEVVIPQSNSFLSGSLANVPDSGAPVYVIATLGGAPFFGQLPGGANGFLINHVTASDGGYSILAFVDEAGTGQPRAGDLIDVQPGPQGAQFPQCSVGSLCTVSFPAQNVVSSATVQTINGPESPVYSVNLQLYSGLKVPVSAFVVGPDGGGDLLDLALTTAPGVFSLGFANDLGSFGELQDLVQPPVLPLTIQVTYSDLTTQLVSVGSGSYFQSAPVVTVPLDAGFIAWTGVSTDGGVGYLVSICDLDSQTYDCVVADGGFTAESQGGLGFTYNLSTADYGSITATDGHGNTAVAPLGLNTLAPSLSATAILDGIAGFRGTVLYAGTAPASAPIYVTLTQGDAGAVLAGTTVTAAAPNFFLDTQVAGDTLTAWMDVLGTGHWVPVAGPFGTTYTGALSEAAVTIVDPAPATLPASPIAPPQSYTGDTGFVVYFPEAPGFDHYLVNAYNIETFPSYTLLASKVVPAGAPSVVLFTNSDVDGGFSPEIIYGFTWAGVLDGVDGGESRVSQGPRLMYGPGFNPSTPLSGTYPLAGLPDLTLYIGVGDGQDGGDFVTYLPGSLDGGYTLGVEPPSGDALTNSGIWYFIDQHGDGIVHPDDPGVAPLDQDALPWNLAGGEDAGPALPLSPDPFTCVVLLARDGGSGDYVLTFEVASNFALPFSALVESGIGGFGEPVLPLLTLGVPPTQPNHQLIFSGQQSLGTALPGQTTYTFDINTADGGLSHCSYVFNPQ